MTLRKCFLNPFIVLSFLSVIAYTSCVTLFFFHSNNLFPYPKLIFPVLTQFVVLCCVDLLLFDVPSLCYCQLFILFQGIWGISSRVKNTNHIMRVTTSNKYKRSKFALFFIKLMSLMELPSITKFHIKHVPSLVILCNCYHNTKPYNVLQRL